MMLYFIIIFRQYTGIVADENVYSAYMWLQVFREVKGAFCSFGEDILFRGKDLY